MLTNHKSTITNKSFTDLQNWAHKQTNFHVISIIVKYIVKLGI